MSNTPLAVLGNPENRRVQGFVAAVGRDVPCVSYLELLRDSQTLEHLGVDALRIDSPGENAAVAQGLIALGGGPPSVHLQFGEIGYLREYHRGYCTLLNRITRPCLNAPDEIAVMFDKWACHQRFVARGLPRPESFLAPASYAELEARMPPSGRWFLKPLYGSSASGVCALRWQGSRQQLIAPLRIVGRTLVNSLRVKQYTRPAEIAAILDFLLSQGMICERWIPKINLPGGVVDLRVLVIKGEARHRVVRQSAHPMTNLHLGNRRGREAVLRQRLGARRWAAALRLAEQAAACFPKSLYAGVDILVDTAGRSFVGEINAFGDLLPGVLHRGETAYEAIAAHVQRRAV